MNLSPGQAAESLKEIERTQRRSAEAQGYAHSSPQFILWGLIWMAGYAGTSLLPNYGFVHGISWLWLGLIVIGRGWSGTAHTPYAYDQMSYLVSSIFGFGMTFVGGFLYFGSWLARIASEQKDAQHQLSDQLLLLADRNATAAPIHGRDAGAELVVAGSGLTLHRADCDLVSGRDDLHPAGANAADLLPCRLCKPTVS